MQEQGKLFGDITYIDNGSTRVDNTMDISQTDFNLKAMLERD